MAEDIADEGVKIPNGMKIKAKKIILFCHVEKN